MRLLTFTTLYPNAIRPNHGVFVENRLRHLTASGEVCSTVLAPVGYVPPGASVLARRGDWEGLSDIPRHEIRHGISVHHPRYLVIPKIGMTLAPALLYHAAARALARMIDEGFVFDAIDAHYVYPDGIAAVQLGRRFGKPVAITARGSDITQLPKYPAPRRMIKRAIRAADALISVSAALGADLIALGAPQERVHVLRNGIDTVVFHPVDRETARAALSVSGPTLISVGHLIERKGHDRTIQALTHLPDCTLLIAGDGPEREALAALADRLGVAARVRFLGALPHAQLPGYYAAADAMVLSSSREGWANVLLESMACGTPVVASRIPGNPEVVQSEAAGLVVDENTPLGIAAGVRRLLADPPDRGATRAYAERFGWDETTAGQMRVFAALAGHR